MKIKTKNVIEAVLFDFGGVIAKEGFREGLRLIAEKSGVDFDFVEEAGFRLMYSTGFVLGRGVEEDFWQAIKKETGISGVNTELRETILKEFVVRQWLIEFIRQVKDEGLKLYILSDQTNWLDRLNDRYDFYKYFDRIFNSYYMGISKTETELFDMIPDKIGISPDKLLFVDDYKGHIERAQKKGFHTHLFTDQGYFMKDMEQYFKVE